MVSTNQRPESTAIHCGFGFSCHSPTQPTGRTVKVTPAWLGSILSFHCGATPGPTPWNWNAVSANCAWRLTPSASV
ncbi:CxxxxCH/CxxCH domain-containing protein [uncultured Methylobacterium sp.]|uniref:CxxxxCH/CxxCH domain-containing protein n=1 Tax=uncultured Methylobacterium sp. TaxID=157278 RepID=UPI00338DF137